MVTSGANMAVKLAVKMVLWSSIATDVYMLVKVEEGFHRLNHHACAAELPASTDCRLGFQHEFQGLCIGGA